MRDDPDLSVYPPPPGWDDYDPLPNEDIPDDEPSFFRWLVRGHLWRFEVELPQPAHPPDAWIWPRNVDLLGGLAHSVYHDECLPRTNDLSELLVHLRVEHDADDDHVRALVAAYVEWSTDRAAEAVWSRFQEWLAKQEPSS